MTLLDYFMGPFLLVTAGVLVGVLFAAEAAVRWVQRQESVHHALGAIIATVQYHVEHRGRA